MKCPYCGAMNENTDDFCTNCGAYLHAPLATSGTPPSPVVQVDPHSTSNSTSNSTSGDVTVTGPTSVGVGSTTLTSALVPNTQLQAGRYVVTRVLGQGGMGAAVLAQDTRVSNKQVVIKELISDETDQAQRQEDVRNFIREVETLARLDHPLVPTVTDSFQEGSRDLSGTGLP